MTIEAASFSGDIGSGRSPRPAVFFDRDGVLNIDCGYVGHVDRFEWVDGAPEAVKLANDLGYLVFVVTNQAGVARGMYGEGAVLDLHRHMQMQLGDIGARVDEFRYCPHHPEGIVPAYTTACSCRKPSPGMILDLIERWSVARSDSLMIGDKLTDIEAGTAAGIPSALFPGGNLRTFLMHLIATKTNGAPAHPAFQPPSPARSVP
jgi:D-glycero-D-manno-heptose 1,7-bisphosphate phosphatase